VRLFNQEYDMKLLRKSCLWKATLSRRSQEKAGAVFQSAGAMHKKHRRNLDWANN
jgi:hypothetical protein